MGGNSFIGLVDETTVFKYPRIPGDRASIASLNVEARIFKAIGPHDQIIGFKEQKNDGLFIDYATYGSLARYLVENQAATAPQRLRWSCQVTEAIAVIHSKRVIHCDINTQNLLLDIDLNVKLCDFQGRLLKPNGELDSDGGVSENPKFFMPRNAPEHADAKTDICALGSTIFHIVEGHEPFPELDSFSDEEEITTRFSSGLFPEPRFSPIRDVVHKCWGGKYISADEVLWEVQRLCQDH